MYLPALTDEELLVHADQTLHDLTTSDLERELAKRLQARVDLGDDKRIELLDEEDIDSVEALRKHLDAIDSIKSVVEDL